MYVVTCQNISSKMKVSTPWPRNDHSEMEEGDCLLADVVVRRNPSRPMDLNRSVPRVLASRIENGFNASHVHED